jgi:hypothetical protein
MDRMDGPVDNHSPPEAKIALFRSLFRGRDDIYPRRFESLRTGKSGYQPACANEWARGLCDKRAVRCAECPNRRFLPVTDEAIRWYLFGRDNTGRDFVMGVCAAKGGTQPIKPSHDAGEVKSPFHGRGA